MTPAKLKAAIRPELAELLDGGYSRIACHIACEAVPDKETRYAVAEWLALQGVTASYYIETHHDCEDLLVVLERKETP